MNIILLEKIKKLGDIGDEVTVKSGFARNFLVPNKKALYATSDNRKYFEDILKFYDQNIDKDNIVITILTDKSKINIDKILDYGELIELEKKNIFN